MPAWPRYGRRAHAAVAATLALAASLLVATWHLDGRASFLDRLESPLLDLRFLLVGPEPAPGDLVIVALDDEAIREAGAYPLPRATMARLVRALAGARP
ncbi:MAG TPA: CHASE2 domain-containing protein, partial [Methylobacterium sp.]|nr:CHASE2 domain-containing protein [Methylobacterium sp.]